MTDFQIRVPAGELLDRITILEIKSARIRDPDKLANVRRELAELTDVWDRGVEEDETIAELRRALGSVNEALWDIEDHIREEEVEGVFGARFVELARAVYQTNDRRALLKRRVSEHLGSELLEEKSYAGETERLA
ncbi:MAG: DUF6165 family protein [Gemmatimonadota bacterium]|nr:DUF6165 family protein [Gemmatimonadota bacterium]